MGWIIALAVVLGLSAIPLGLWASYDSAGAQLWLYLGPFRRRLYPSDKKREKKTRSNSQKQKRKVSGANAKVNSGGVSDFLSFWNLLWDFLGSFRRKYRVKLLQVQITMAGDDPCDLATNYGIACASLAALEPQLERMFVIKEKHLHIDCDFIQDQTQVQACLDLSITLGRLLSLCLRYGLRAVIDVMKLKNAKKAVQIS